MKEVMHLRVNAK